jgi:membrane protein implicated in regulation of membrane protease activity
MLAIYVISLVIGGGLLLLSLLSGGEGEALEGLEEGGEGLGSVLPVTSLFFWTFFFAFFGLTGALMSLLAPEVGALLIAGLSVGVGMGVALVAARVLRGLRRVQVDSSVQLGDVVGRLGRVVVPVGPKQPGKVRVELKGRTVDLLAYGEDEQPLEPTHRVLVHDILEDGSVRVTSAEPPRGAEPPAPAL